MADAEKLVHLFEALNQRTLRRVALLDAADGSSIIKAAHYTSADNAIKIISGKSLWLRNAAMMNDFMEISFGRACLNVAITAAQEQIRGVINQSHAGLYDEIIDWLKKAENTVSNHTYMISFSEHSANDDMGRLSMWRAYGGPTAGVAIIFNTDAFKNANAEMNAFSVPVMYGHQEFLDAFEEFRTALVASADLLASMQRTDVGSILTGTLQDFLFSSKHKGFEEEREWRIIHTPFIHPSKHITQEIESIGGIPQNVCKIPLQENPELQMPELGMNNLIHRVLIGPCQYPEQIAFAINQTLTNANVENARDRIQVTGIPLRQ